MRRPTPSVAAAALLPSPLYRGLRLARPVGHVVLSGPARHGLRPIVLCLGLRLGTRPEETRPGRHGVPCRPNLLRAVPGPCLCRAEPGRPVGHLYRSHRGLREKEKSSIIGPVRQAVFFFFAYKPAVADLLWEKNTVLRLISRADKLSRTGDYIFKNFLSSVLYIVEYKNTSTCGLRIPNFPSPCENVLSIRPQGENPIQQPPTPHIHHQCQKSMVLGFQGYAPSESDTMKSLWLSTCVLSTPLIHRSSSNFNKWLVTHSCLQMSSGHMMISL
jgi:hypothetical protein